MKLQRIRAGPVLFSGHSWHKKVNTSALLFIDPGTSAAVDIARTAATTNTIPV
ncbi:hypothetical protein IIA95_01570 [Patescibacteria group bacterium]|nr:hypothetical protein [Patescibacteria group bacterium]